MYANRERGREPRTGFYQILSAQIHNIEQPKQFGKPTIISSVAELIIFKSENDWVRVFQPLDMASANASLENLCRALGLPLAEESIEAFFDGEMAYENLPPLDVRERPVNEWVSVVSFGVPN